MMAAQSTDDQNKNPGEELDPTKNVDSQIASTEDLKAISPKSVFVNSEPLREEQVQNAVKFLSHPKVRGSPIRYRRSFLENKGLTKEEIDEAFRRVPDPSPSGQMLNNNQATPTNFSSNIQSQASVQALQPTTAISSVGTISRYRFHWSHAVFAIGFLATSGAGTIILVKRVVVPRVKSWIRKIVLEEEHDMSKNNGLHRSLAEETASAAKAAASAATDVARISRELLDSQLQEKKFFGELRNLLDVQLREMKAMTAVTRNLQGQANTSLTSTTYTNSSKQPYANGKPDLYSHTVSAEPSVAPHPPSYMEILSMVQRGERPPNVKDIDDSPPNPNQQIANPRLAPRTKPWEVGQIQRSSNPSGAFHDVRGNGLVSQSQADTSIPWWQRKNARITEIENGGELLSASRSSGSLEQPIQRTWVPPQPPPIAMPEAAEAIRRPKSLIQGEQLADNQPVLPPSDVTTENGNGVGSNQNSSEIQMEENEMSH